MRRLLRRRHSLGRRAHPEDDLKLNAQQTIAKSEILDLTNGRVWNVRQSGGSEILFDAWDWELQIERWGCAAGAIPTK